ncbi:MAG: hypothetical protein WCK90_04410 [archaeon]
MNKPAEEHDMKDYERLGITFEEEAWRLTERANRVDIIRKTADLTKSRLLFKKAANTYLLAKEEPIRHDRAAICYRKAGMHERSAEEYETSALMPVRTTIPDKRNDRFEWQDEFTCDWGGSMRKITAAEEYELAGNHKKAAEMHEIKRNEFGINKYSIDPSALYRNLKKSGQLKKAAAINEEIPPERIRLSKNIKRRLQRQICGRKE